MTENNSKKGNSHNKISTYLENKLPEKLTDEEELYKLARFVAILTIAGLFLTYLYSLDLDMRFARRQVGKQTNTLLQTTSVNPSFHPYGIWIPEETDGAIEIREQLQKLGFEQIGNQKNAYVIREISATREKTIDTYINSLREEGKVIHTSPSTLLFEINGEPHAVDIVPACVGWVGLFAVISLMIAYPAVKWEKRVLGMLIAAPLMHFMNLVRLSTTIYSGWRYGTTVLEIVHSTLWRTLLIFWALFLWIMWLKYIVEPDEEKEKHREN